MFRHNARVRGTQLGNVLAMAGLATAILFHLASFALAQNGMSAESARSAAVVQSAGREQKMPAASPSPLQAPVGHFQPAPRETPALGDEDISRTKEQVDFDNSLRICRGC